MSVRVACVIVLVIIGLVCGIYSRDTSASGTYKMPKIERGEKKFNLIEKTLGDGPFVPVKMEFWGARLPTFQRGKLSSLLLVDKVVYTEGEPLILIKPTLYEFAEDGRTITKVAKADEGTVTFGEEAGQTVLESANFFGDARVQIYMSKEDKKE